MLNPFWNWFAIIVTIASILACWWLLHWTKGISDRDEDQVGDTGHVWDHDIRELNNPLPRWWLNLFNLTIVFSLVYLALYPGLGNLAGVLGWTQLQRYEAQIASADAAQANVYDRFAPMEPAALVRDPEAMDIGRRLFGNHCAMCHGSDARGGPGFPNLTDGEWLYGGDFDTVLASIRDGRQGMMPPLGPALGEDGVREVTEYVVQLSGRAADAELAAAGKQRFDTFCVACHGPDGSGNPTFGAPALTNDIWLHGGDRDAIAATVADGRTGNMPAHAELISEERQRLLAAYVIGMAEAAALDGGRD